MENFILHSTPIQELRSMIGEAVRDELKNYRPDPNTSTPAGDYLSRREVCDLLKISLATLHYWTKAGTLQGYRIGGRVLYKLTEVQDAISKIPNLKKRRA